MSQSNKSKITILIIALITLLIIAISLFFVFRVDHEEKYNNLKNDLVSYINNPEFATTGRGFDDQQRQDFLAQEVLPAFIKISDRAKSIECNRLPTETVQECEEVTSIVEFMAEYYRRLIDLSGSYSYQELQESAVSSEDQDSLNYINQNQGRLNQDQNRLKQLIQ